MELQKVAQLRKPQTNLGCDVKGELQKPITLLGAGSWGTALALYLSRRGQPVRLFSIETAEIAAMQRDGENQRYLPGIKLPKLIQPMLHLTQAVSEVSEVMVVVPSSGFRQTLVALKPLLSQPLKLICATKGLDAETGKLLSEVAEEIFGENLLFAMLSGPSFAREVAAGLPCAVVIASRSSAFREELKERFDSPLFRIHTSSDVVGVEIGGVTKNVIAIATGILDGMELGANARSALITFGLDEITRLGIALGGQPETFTGLSGLGDLILTCSDNQSRNRRLGLALGKGQDIEAAEKEIGQVVEGKRNAELVVKLAEQHSIKMPICEMTWQILQGRITIKEAVAQGFPLYL